MLTRLGFYADKAVEIGWLAVAVLTPLFFNVYSSRVFEPDKISLLRSLVLLMTVAWLIKLLEGGVRAVSASDAPTLGGKLNSAARGAAESSMPSRLGFLRVPMLIPILVYALAYLISSLFTMTADASIWGSYQRLQGTYSQYSYMMLGLLVIANMRSRAQLERLITFIILTSIPVALYGLLQANRLDPLPWAGDTASRVASTMGNAIFVAAWLIIAVPFTLYRLLNGLTLVLTPAPEPEVEAANDPRRRRANRGYRAADAPTYGWAVVGNIAGILLISMLVFYFVLKLVAGLPLPNAELWPSLPLALVLFYLGCWAIEWIYTHRDEPVVAGPILWTVGGVLFFMSLLAFIPSWTIGQDNVGIDMKTDGVGFLWAIFAMLAWGSVTAASYAAAAHREGEAAPNRNFLRWALNASYVLLIIAQLVCIYLTQSRGPWLGLGVGLVAFAVALWLIGRHRNVSWMARLGGTASALVLVAAIFVGALNIPGSPLRALDNMPVIGRGIERLGTLTRTEDGTGKVRTLIWQGATALIVSDPVRTVIGYGPESMYVVYNKYYPPELAHWELRNATPDRSHNVEFDHMVTMGVMGLLAYFFVVAAFFFYAIRVIKRSTNTQDQLLAVTLVAALGAHFVEIQTGIQIAATWSYFYLIIGMMVVFGYFLTTHLRDSSEALEAETPAVYANNSAEAPQPEEEAVPASTTGGRAVAAAAAGAGKSSSRTAQATIPATVAGQKANRSRSSAQPNGANSSGSRTGTRDNGNGTPSTGSRGANASDSRRRPPTRAQIVEEPQWFRNPALIAVYALAVIAAFVFIWKVNVATVQADTLYKQGQAYDSATRWQDSIARYQKAIDLQPNQDYYYLFEGRAYLEWAKQVDQDMQGNNPRTNKPYTEQDKQNERLARLSAAEQQLQTARNLNPLNTDHYANLGRLYLYWSDPSGGNDPSKSQLAVDYMKRATDNSPGNAQLWDELAVAQARNGQFSDAMKSLDYSQTQVDSTFQRTPFIRGQLLQERAGTVRNNLIKGLPLPKGGETDYGKLMIQAGQAFSDSIALDSAYFVDNGMQDRVDFFLAAGQPFTNTNSTIDKATLSNVLTSTIITAYNQQQPQLEKAFADVIRGLGLYSGTEPKVPSADLQKLWANPQWAAVPPGGGTKSWTNPDMSTVAKKAVVPYAALGFIKYRLGDTPAAVANYARAVDIDPSNYFNQKNLGSLLSEEKQCKDAITHIEAALQIIQTSSDLNTDSQRQQDFQNIQSELQRVKALTDCKQ